MTLARSIVTWTAAAASLTLLSCRQPSDLPADFESRVAAAAARQAGAPLYRQACALCHGEAGDGRGPRSSAFAVPPRDFTSPAWRRAATAQGTFRTIRDGLPGTAMPAWRSLGDDRLIDLTAYVLSLSPTR